MKTKSNLLELLPQLVKLMCDEAEYGHYQVFGDSDADCHTPWEDNGIWYEEDGWTIDIEYCCLGEFYDGYLENACGKVTKIEASYYDEETDEYHQFSEEELHELWAQLDVALEKMV